MARISTYPIDTIVNTDDFVIGTDYNNLNVTKNYTIASIIDLATSGGYINAAVAVGATTETTIDAINTFYSLAGTLVTSVSNLWAVGTGTAVNKIIYSGTASQATNIISTVNIKGASGSISVNIALFKNDTEIAGTRQTLQTSGTTNTSVCLQTVNTLVENDVISVKVMNTTNADNVTAEHFNITASLV